MHDMNQYLNYSAINREELDLFIDLYLLSGIIDPNRKKTGVDIFRYFEYGLPIKYLDDHLDPN
jgi:hypothetical protein